MMKHVFRMVVVALLCSFVAAPAQASLTLGQTGLITAPASVADDSPGAENTAQQAFDERQGVTLAQAIAVDGGTIAAGTQVDSHMIFFNTAVGTSRSTSRVLWTFDTLILGVMSDAPGKLEKNTNDILGAVGTIYPGKFANRGLESGDWYEVSGNTIDVYMVVTEPGDWIRVVTEAAPSSAPTVPAPGAILLGSLGTGLVGWFRRRRLA